MEKDKEWGIEGETVEAVEVEEEEKVEEVEEVEEVEKIDKQITPVEVKVKSVDRSIRVIQAPSKKEAIIQKCVEERLATKKGIIIRG